MENAKNHAPGAPSANGDLDSSSLSNLTAPLPTPHGTPRILLTVLELAGHD